MDKLNFVRQLIQTHKLLIFSKPTCGYCSRVKSLFKSLGAHPFVYEVVGDDASEIQSALKSITRMSTVPQVFINGQLIGGCDDTHELHNKNLLVPKLKELEN
eukprot:gene9685-11886_t